MVYDSNKEKWKETECLTVTDNNGNIIPVTDQFAISDMRIVDGKLMIPGTDTASYRPYGDYFVLEKYGEQYAEEYRNKCETLFKDKKTKL